MRKRTKSPKGPRAAATRGTRGRGRTRGGSTRTETVTNNNTKGPAASNSTRGSNSRRGGLHSSSLFSSSATESKDNQNIISIDRNGSGKANGSGAPGSASDNLATPKPSSDYYLHKKFKKLTTTLVAESPELSSSAPCSSKSVHLSNGVLLDATSSSSQVVSSINGESVANKPVNGCIISQPTLSQDNPALSSTNNNMVYKPKFRISVETETSSSATSSSSFEHNRSESSSTSSPTATTSSTYNNTTNNNNKPEDLSSMNLSRKSSTSSSASSSTEAGKIAKGLRLDRQSLDDRISKIIDENQSLLEWPEHFTKKLKSHTSRNSSSSSSSSHNHQRTSQVAIMSGGSTTELYPQIPSVPSASSHPQHPQHRFHQNGLVRHTSFDMASSGGTVEFLTNPLILKAQNDLLKANGYSQLVQTVPADFSTSSPSLSELSALPLATAAAASLIVPKKRRRLSPTPSRLCGGEVSELPVSETTPINKGYYQDVDMTVRVSNCSGAKVTIRTNNGSGSGGSVQSSVGYGRLIDSSVPSPIAINAGNSSSLFFSPNSLVNNLECKPLSSGEGLRLSNASIPMGKISPPSSFSPSTSGGRGKRKQPQSSSSSSSLTSRVPEITVEPLPLKMTLGDSSNKFPKKELLRESIVLSKEANNKPNSLSPREFPSPKISNQPPPPSIEVKATPVNLKISPVAEHQQFQQQTTGIKTTTPEEKTSSLPPPASPSNKTTPFQVLQTTSSNPKRPNFLALKPVNSVPKKSDVGVLPSPETPRVAKSYNQMFINGNAYTYLGFKVSTRSSYTCLFKPQPMFIPQNTDPKLSMYSNWQPCPKDPKDLKVDISTNDSRVNGRKSPKTLYTSATGKNCDTLTVSSPDSQLPISSPMTEKSPLAIFANELRSAGPVTSLSRSSEAVPPASSGGSSLHDQTKFPKLSPNNIPSYSSSPSSSHHQHKDNFKSAVVNLSSSGGRPLSPRTSLSTSNTQSLLKTNHKSFFSSSELSSADESSNMGKDSNSNKRRRTDDHRGPLALTANNKSKKGDLTNSDHKDFLPDDSNSATESVNSGGVIMSRSDSSRVKIMEGGFESNEDYTYVRGRGRGRYVCEACGIRCKKPSMLRKHLKTHTDLRPYTCKLCNFSFKTKGNLTKHQKSKSHHKKCISMGIHPESSQSLAATGPNISDSNSDNDSDDDDDDCGDMDSDSQCDDDGDNGSLNGNDESESVEKEIALSLLDLSSVSRLVSSASSSTTDSEWSMKEKQLKEFSKNIISEEDKSASSATPSPPTPYAAEAPMDLSVKSKPGPSSSSLVRGEPEPKKMKIEKNGLVRSIGVVGEAQLWEPEEVPNECLNLKKVLNTSNSPPPQHTKPVTVASAVSVSVVKEIKQEVIEDSCESFPSKTNGHALPEFIHKRVRQDSEASNSSVSLPAFSSSATAEKTNDRSSTPTSSGGGQGSSQSAPVKLHQPWLSPPDRAAKESIDSKDSVETPPVQPPPVVPPSIDIKAGSSTLESINNKLLEEAKAKAAAAVGMSLAEQLPDGSSPNSKIFAPLPGLKPQAEFRQPSGAQALVKEDGKAECNVCGKSFARASQLTLHMNIHYIERPFRCDPCGVSFRTKGHLIKHRRSSSHDCKVYLTEAWGVANEENPRPFKCPDCKIAFRIHGHLAKHLRSKMHIMRMECLGKLPFGIYFEMEKSGMNLNEIDTTDCDMSLVSLQNVARKIYGENWMERLTVPVEEPA